MKKKVTKSKIINVLILEDSTVDYELIASQLELSGLHYNLCRAATKKEFVKEVNSKPDIILADINLPKFNALNALLILKEKDIRIPFLLVTRELTDEVAVECMKQGADDYILKSDLKRLPTAIENALYNINLERENEIALNKLAKSENKFRSLYESMPLPVLIYNPDTFEILDVNNAAINMYGYSKAEFLKLTLKDIRPPEEIKKLELKKKLYSQDKASFLGEWKHMNRQGAIFDVEIYNYPISIHGLPARVSIVHDISERKLAVDAIHRSEVKYRSIFDEAPIGISNVDADGKFISVNGALEEMLGYAGKELIGVSIFDITHPEDRNSSHFQLNQLISGNQPYIKVEKRYLKKTGETVWVNISVSAIYNLEKKFLNTVALIEDITQKKKQASKIIESEKSYRGLFNSIPDAIFILNENGRFIDINENGIKMYGYTKTEMIGQSPSMFDVPGLNMVDPNFEKIRSAYNGIPERLEWWGKRKNGEIFPHEVSLSAGTYFGKKVVVAIARDMTERKKYELSLAESEKRYRDFADSLPQIVFETDKEGKLVFINKHGAEALGYPADHVYSSPNVMSFLIPEDREKAIKNFTGNLKGEEGPGREYRLLKNDGTFIDCIIYSSPLLRENRIEGIRGIVVDISPLKKIEKALQTSEKKYRMLYEKNLAAVFKCTINGELIEYNEAFSKMFGYSVELLKNYENEIRVEEELRHSIIPLLKVEKELNNIEINFQKKGGTAIWVLGNIGLVQNENEKSYSVQGTLIDITDKKKVEEEAKLLLLAIKGVKEYVIMLDEKQRIVFANEAFIKASEYSEDEILGESVSVLSSDKNPSSLFEDIKRVKTEGNWEGEFIQKTKSGREFPIRLSISKIIIGNKTSGYDLAIAMDISQQKKFEQELRDAKELAEEMNNLKSIFLANMSHELRTPMIGILGYAGMIQEDSVDPELNEMAGAIVKSANRLTDTLNMILDLSKVEANKVDLKLRQVKIYRIIKKAVEHYKIEAQQKKIGLMFSAGDENLYAMLDERLFSQIIGNLINNAIKYTEKGKVELQLKQENDFAVITVSDTGIGISEDKINLVFEPFRQVSEGYNRKFEGTGLGLTISKKFIELMNGSIQVTSEINKGSVFTVLFPMHSESEKNPVDKLFHPKAISTVVKPPAKIKNPSILLVEDEPLNANIISLFLRDYYQIDNASSAVEAIEKAKTKKYDVILMDINLKGMNGLEAVKVIRQKEEYRETPVVAVTAYAMPGDMKKFLNNGCTHYLPKPFTKRVIIELLDSILSN